MQLKIFSDQSFLPKRNLPDTLKYVPILIPFWGKLADDYKHFKTKLFDKFVDKSHLLLKMTSLEEADIAIFPVHWHLSNLDEVIPFIEKAQKKNKTVAIFSHGDWDYDLNYENTIIFFTASFQSRRKFNEFAMPSWTSDYIGQNFKGQIFIRKKEAQPTISFCGYAPPLGLPFGLKKLKAYLRMAGDLTGLSKKFYFKTGYTNRVKALSNLSKSSFLKTNFITRSNFAFNTNALQTFSLSLEEQIKKLRSEYIQNIINSDYVICCSGYENYSIRFYETLSCGRIPVFINTDCVLPYDFAIDWKKYCVWIEENEISLIEKKIMDFHNNLSEQDFINLQCECRNIWEKWISPEGFFGNFYLHLEQYNSKIKPMI